VTRRRPGAGAGPEETPKAPRAEARSPAEDAMAQARDPVCGMNVDTDRAPAQGTYAGQKVYFCSAGCRRKYELSHRPD
jgi:YHS domain-containing protein